MATDTRNLPANIIATADFRTWGSGLAAQFTAIGLVQTSDTGQINWTTVNAPSSSNTYAGYEIWRFNDSLQATKPVFIKVEYGINSVSFGQPMLRITTATGTNGAGTPSGQVGAVRATMTASGNKSAGVTLPSYCSGSTSRLNLCTNLDAASATFAILVLIERTKSAAGADTGDGIATWVTSTGLAGGYQFIPFTGSVPGSVTNNPALDLAAGGLTVSGSDVLLAPSVVFYGKALFASWCAYRYADPGLTELVSITMDHLGATRTYMPLGDGATVSGHNLAGTSGYSLAMLWE